LQEKTRKKTLKEIMILKCFGKDKKGQVLSDIFIIAIFLLIMMVGTVIVGVIMFAVDTQVQATAEIPAEGKAGVTTIKDTYLMMDTVIIFFWLSFFLSALITSWFIDTHPVFFILSIVALIIIFVAIVGIANLNESVLTSSDLITTTAQFPKIVYITEHFLPFMIIQAFVIMISLYAKTRSVNQ